MTEAEWLACTDLESMLCHAGTRLTSRKALLIGCGFCRRLWNLLDGVCRDGRTAIEVAERIADGKATGLEIEAADQALQSALILSHRHNGVRDPIKPLRHLLPGQINSRYGVPAFLSLSSTAKAARRAILKRRRAGEYSAQTRIVRDVTGNPFRPPTIDPSWLAWNGGTVTKLAQSIYDERAFDRLPVLADALEDAGCDNADILAHCRQPGEHVRGCWVVDLLLGKC
jgi:hypothetical protein